MRTIFLGLLILLSSQITQAQSHEHNFVECMFQKHNNEWIYIFSASFAGSFEIKTGEQTALHYIWFKNPQTAKYAETALCSHVTKTFADGSLEVTSNVHNADYFADIKNSITCSWEAENAALQSRAKAVLKRGQYFVHEYRKQLPAQPLVQLIHYLPTKSEVKKMDPDVAEDICFKLAPQG